MRSGHTIPPEEETIDIHLDARREGRWTVLEVKGEVDLFTAPKLKERAIDVIDEGTTALALDLRGVDFMDSTGLGVLIGTLRRLSERDGQLLLVAPQPAVLRVLTVTGLHKVFAIRDTLEEAATS